MSYKSPADWTVHYANGYARDVDVTADSYMAIIKDVLNAV